MAISPQRIAEIVETFLRSEYQISQKDQMFTRDAHLFEMGYVDSLGFTELIGFLESRFDMTFENDQLFSEEFTTINGISRIILTGKLPHNALR